MPAPEVFVPVAVDADRYIAGRQMSRVTYFVIATDTPGSEWRIPLPIVETLAGVGALGVAGLVYRAIRTDPDSRSNPDADLFVSASEVSALFALEQTDPTLSIQLEDVWIPTDWLHRARDWGTETRRARDPTRGLVYRVALPTFQAAYRITAGDVDVEALAAMDATADVFFSPLETESLRQWAQGEIDQARRAFPQKEMKLRYRKSSPVDV